MWKLRYLLSAMTAPLLNTMWKKILKRLLTVYRGRQGEGWVKGGAPGKPSSDGFPDLETKPGITHPLHYKGDCGLC